jgi:hypothetical protein
MVTHADSLRLCESFAPTQVCSSIAVPLMPQRIHEFAEIESIPPTHPSIRPRVSRA